MVKTLYDEEGVSLAMDEYKGVYTLKLNRGQNLVNPEMIQLMGTALAIVEDAPHPKALVVTGVGKFFSNGLDRQYMKTLTGVESDKMLASLWKLGARLLVLDCRTVTAINGHAFGAGLFLALLCDYRLMRTSRGYLCWPEAMLGMRLTKGFSELTRARVRDPAVLRDAVLNGKRYGSRDALTAKLIDGECPIDELEARSKDLAEKGLAKNLGLKNFNPEKYKMMKIELYVDTYRALSSGRVTAPPNSRL
mmetsp:Transcript_6107/g.15123  ORF Transcript_6107/g.15123 Transcript_6107/m.15123 type:complete len:249 (-) Transcript_6107:536-1282(-)